MCNITLRHVCVMIVTMEKQLSILYSERMFVALVIWNANRESLLACMHMCVSEKERKRRGGESERKRERVMQ